MGIHSIEKKWLSAKGMLRKIHLIFKKIPEPCKDSRGLKSKISIADCLMSALAIFGLKFPSLLQFDEERNEETIKHNLNNLYGVETAPCDTYIRQKLDELDPDSIRPAFTTVFSLLQRGKILEEYKVLDKYLVIACDGTGMFSSNSVHCSNCCEKHHKNGTVTYYHQMLGAVVVHPDKKEVFPICPEPISKNDGSKKNDCEQNAMKRLLIDFQKEHPHLEVIFTEDALSAKGPYLQKILDIGSHFVVNVNPTGNPSLFEWLKGIELEKKTVKNTKGETIELQFYNDLPLNNSQDMTVNFIDCIIRDKKGKVTHFSWVTDLLIRQDNVYTLSKIGRSRWHIENETFNTLKNQGYQFEHNYGHGNKNLCHVFGMMMMLAFLVDQVQQRCCPLFQEAVKKARRKIRFWAKLRIYFSEFYFNSWLELFAAIANKHRRKITGLFNSS